jgi:GNAT superfamily N-acetyltransferase
MEDEYAVSYVDDPEESAWGIIGRGVGTFNKQQAGENDFQRLCYVLNSPEEEIMGGVLAELYWKWLFIDLLWVKEELRGQGYGHELLTKVETEARNRGARNAYLDTFSFQAPEFYAKHGYHQFGELQDFPKGHQRLFLTKLL